MKLNLQKFSQKIITALLVAKLIFMGMQAADRIQQGESVTETLIWLINQYIPVLQQTSRQEDEEKKSDRKLIPPAHR